tara:strand:- start:372 stop:1928 length:1557 start_codon:yes stop_codon:yes gene_type:complete
MKNQTIIFKKNNNMYYNNNLKLVIVTLLMLAISSCSPDDFLEKIPLNELSAEGSYQTQSDAEAAIGAVYGEPAQMSQHYYKWQHTVFSDMRADNTHGGFVADFITHELHSPNASAYEPLGYAWSQPYRYIAGANSVLDNVPGIEDPNFSEASKNSILGQAYFIRAFNYFQLVRIFGGVPLQLSTNDSDLFKSRSTEAETYSQIESDLLMAESLLPKEHSTNFLTRTRATRGAAQAMLAKVYAETSDYTKCAEYAGKVIDSGVYELLPVFDHLFDGEHDYSRESILEMEHVPDGNVASYHPLQMLPPGDFSQYEGSKPGSSWEVAYHRFNTITTDLIAAYDEMGDDVRKWSTVITVNDRTLITQPNYGYGPDSPVSFMYKMGRSGEIFGAWNVMLLRLADIILLRAEALNATGQTAEALTLLNQVRARAELAPSSAISQAEVKLAILKDRRLELVAEFNRYWDLKRYFNDDTAMAQYLNGLTDDTGASLGYQATAEKLFLPIPQPELDVNPNLVQNPGY